jgi:hypothetical protein
MVTYYICVLRDTASGVAARSSLHGGMEDESFLVLQHHTRVRPQWTVPQLVMPVYSHTQIYNVEAVNRIMQKDDVVVFAVPLCSVFLHPHQSL